MARTVTYLELYNRLERAADIEGDTHLSAVEKRDIINVAVAETWDVICNTGLAEKYVKSVTFNSVAGQMEYPLATAVSAGDFYRIHQLYTVEPQGQLRPLQRVQPSELRPFKAPVNTVPMKLYYIPCAPKPDPAIQAPWEATVFDGINGWEEHTVMTACFNVKAKKDDGYGQFGARKQELERRMAMLGNVDFGEPIRVSRKRRSRAYDYFPYNNMVNGYGIRGDKIELYYLDAYAWQ